VRPTSVLLVKVFPFILSCIQNTCQVNYPWLVSHEIKLYVISPKYRTRDIWKIRYINFSSRPYNIRVFGWKFFLIQKVFFRVFRFTWRISMIGSLTLAPFPQTGFITFSVSGFSPGLTFRRNASCSLELSTTVFIYAIPLNIARSGPNARKSLIRLPPFALWITFYFSEHYGGGFILCSTD